MMNIVDRVSLKFNSINGCVDDLGRKWGLYSLAPLSNYNTFQTTLFNFNNDDGEYLNIISENDATRFYTNSLDSNEFCFQNSTTFEFEVKDFKKKTYIQPFLSFYNNQNTGNGWFIGIDINGLFRLYDSTYNNSIILSSADVTGKGWVKYTIMYNFENSMFYFYINGVLDKNTILNNSFITNSINNISNISNLRYVSTLDIGYSMGGNTSISRKAVSFKIKSLSIYDGLKYTTGSNVDLSKFCKLMNIDHDGILSKNKFILNSASNLFTCTPDIRIPVYKNKLMNRFIDKDNYTPSNEKLYYINELSYDTFKIFNSIMTSPSSYNYLLPVKNYNKPYYINYYNNSNDINKTFSYYINSVFSINYAPASDADGNIYIGYMFHIPPFMYDKNIIVGSIRDPFNYTLYKNLIINYDSINKKLICTYDSTTTEIPSETSEFNFYSCVVNNVFKCYINNTVIISSKDIYLIYGSTSPIILFTSTYNIDGVSCISGVYMNAFFFMKTNYVFEDRSLTIDDMSMFFKDSDYENLNYNNPKPIIYTPLYKPLLHGSMFVNIPLNNLKKTLPNIITLNDGIKINNQFNEVHKDLKDSIKISYETLYEMKNYRVMKEYFIVGVGDTLENDLVIYDEYDTLIKIYKNGQPNKYGEFSYINKSHHTKLFVKYGESFFELDQNSEMIRGYLDVEVDERSCKNPSFKIRCNDHDTGIMIGDYALELRNESYYGYIKNLDVSKRYDITLIDTSGKIEYQVMSNRQPTLL